MLLRKSNLKGKAEENLKKLVTTGHTWCTSYSSIVIWKCEFLQCFLTQWGGRSEWRRRGRGLCCWSVGRAAGRGNRARSAAAPTGHVAQKTGRGSTGQLRWTLHASQWTHYLRKRNKKSVWKVARQCTYMKVPTCWHAVCTAHPVWSKVCRWGRAAAASRPAVRPAGP